jgi:hypothetical protein
MSTPGHSVSGSQSLNSKKRKRGCADSDADKARKFLDNLYEGDGIMRKDREVTRVIESIIVTYRPSSYLSLLYFL